MSRKIGKACCAAAGARRADSLAVSESYKMFTILVNTVVIFRVVNAIARMRRYPYTAEAPDTLISAVRLYWLAWGLTLRSASRGFDCRDVRNRTRHWWPLDTLSIPQPSSPTRLNNSKRKSSNGNGASQ